MWQKFRKREEAIKVYYKDKGEPARDHLPRTAVDGVISWEPVSMHWNIILSVHLETMPWPQVCQRKERSCQDVIIPPHPTPPQPHTSGDDAMLSVAASVSEEGTQLPGRYYPTPPHPTPAHLETMPCWVWPQVCERKERSCEDVIISPHPTPPHLETMPCWVWPQVCQRKERSCQEVIIPPHPTPRIWKRCHVECGRKCVRGRNADPTPHRIWRRCHVECGHKCVRGRNAAARTLLSHPTPPHPPGIWRRCYVDCGRNCDADVGFWVMRMVVGEWPFYGCEILLFWLRNRLFLVAESFFLVAESVPFWLRKRLFLVAEACLILVAESPKFGCGSVEIWFRNRTLSITNCDQIIVDLFGIVLHDPLFHFDQRLKSRFNQTVMLAPSRNLDVRQR